MSVVTPERKIDYRWHDEDTLQLLHEETVVAECFWNGGEWIFFDVGPDGEVDTDRHPGRRIEIDSAQEAKFREEYEAIAAEPEGIREALYAELRGRRQMYRDETMSYARIRAVMLARNLVRDMHLARTYVKSVTVEPKRLSDQVSLGEALEVVKSHGWPVPYEYRKEG